jgi:hypothetical protein
MLIKELVRLNTNAEFFNDVQLRWFWDVKKNAKLAKGYIFTLQAGENRKSTVDALDMVRFGLTDPGSENRMLFMATFGQGKTHLALAMANFFSKPPESTEVQHLIKSLKHAYGESPAIKNFTDLKERNPRHLVVCLQGDEVGFDLSSYFVREVEQSLKAELSTTGGMLPLWFKTALDTLDTSVASQRAKADAFLASREMDLPKLRQRLDQKDASLYDLVRDLIEHVTGVRPDLGARLSLNAIVSHVCKEYCGPGKPYAGLVILFDEFNAFMHSYSKRDTAGTPLQDLLNGIANNRGNSVFVGFSQRDPMTIVNSLPPTNRDALTLEMSRIPQNQRTMLFNNLETVLDAYIGADETSLNSALQASKAWPALLDAEQTTQILFKRRYERELQWGSEKFRRNVTIGCFPLHPVTAALLCAIDLAETGSNARGLLQFVLKSKESIDEKPVAMNGVPTWIRATRMVDWFGKTLCSEEIHWEQYVKAGFDGGGDLSDHHKEVLKAMLLHLIAKLPMANVKYEQAIALLAGISNEDAQAALKTMADRNWIDRDSTNNRYTFLSVSGGDRDLRDYIKKEVEQTQIKLDTLQESATIAVTGFRPTEVPVEWGNSGDWQANPALLTSDFFSVATLKEILSRGRGSVVWLIPRDENDRMQLEASAQTIVDAACGTAPQPLVVFLPNAPFPGVHVGLKKLQVLASLTQPKRMEFAAFLPLNKTRINDELREQMQGLRASPRKWFAHASLMPAFQADNLKDDALIKRVVTDCFKKAPSSFVRDQKEENPRLRKASALLGKLLLQNQAPSFQQQLLLQPNDGNLKMAENILDTILKVGRPAAWGVLSPSRHLQEPTNAKTGLAWGELSSAFPSAGAATGLKGSIELLKNSPYGYDANSLTLLLCAWVGFYRHDLEITLGTASHSIASLQVLLDDGRPADFIDALSSKPYRIKRRDRTVALLEIQNILSRVQQISTNPFARQDANDAIVKLAEFLDDGGNTDQVMRNKVTEAKDRVTGDLALADAYDTRAADLLEKLSTIKKVPDALSLLAKARDLPAYSGVKSAQPAVAEIVAIADKTLEKAVGDTCQRLSILSQITDFGRQEDELKSCQKILRDKTHLQNEVIAALAALNDAKEQLEAQQAEEATLRAIGSLSTQVPLVELEKNLAALDLILGGSEKVCGRIIAKRKEITDQIAALNIFAEGLEARINSVKDGLGIRALEREIDGRIASFSGHATNETKLMAAAGRCTQLAEFFSAINRLNGQSINKLQDCETILKECEAARQQYSATVSQGQSDLLGQIESAVRKQAEAKSQAAVAWLEEMAAEWNKDSSNPIAFIQRLTASPAFIPEDTKVALLALRAAVQAKLEAQQAEEATLRTINSLSTQVPMVELEKNLATLDAVAGTSEKVTLRVAVRRKEMADQVAVSNDFADGLSARIDSVRDANGIRTLEREIYSKAGLFVGHATTETKLAAATARCTQLTEFFSAINRLNGRSINNPADLEAILRECEAIRQQYSGSMSQEQLELIGQVESAKRKDAVAKGQTATAWVDRMSAEWSKDSSNPIAFIQKLSASPAFVPENVNVALLALRATVQGKLEAQQAEEATLRAINSLSAQVPMLELEKNVALLEAITDPSEKVALRVTAKRKEITDQIVALNSFADGLAARIDSVQDASGIRKLEREIYGRVASFVGHATNETKLVAATGRCTQLAEFFTTISRLIAKSIDNPQELDAIFKECNAVRQQYSATVSQQQSELIGQIEAAKRKDAEAKGQTAVAWLEEMAAEWNNDSSNPAGFIQKLRETPVFLPEGARVTLLALRGAVQAKLEANEEEWIVSRFQAVTDKSRRQKLLKRLQDLLSHD